MTQLDFRGIIFLRTVIHIDHKKRLKNIWYGMKRRCSHPSASDYIYGIADFYYLKGIRVCDEWSGSFDAFYAWAISHGYRDGLTIDRIDSDGDYTPSNCQWVTRSENCKKAALSKRDNNCGSHSRRYFVVRHICGYDWGKVLATRLSYSDAMRLIKETPTKPGVVCSIKKYSRNAMEINQGDFINI